MDGDLLMIQLMTERLRNPGNTQVALELEQRHRHEQRYIRTDATTHPKIVERLKTLAYGPLDKTG